MNSGTNKHTIEYLNLKGLESYDNANSLKDDKGESVLQYRSANMVLGASSKVALITPCFLHNSDAKNFTLLGVGFYRVKNQICIITTNKQS